MRLIFDAHLDLSLNAIDYNRDLRLSLEDVQREEQGMADLMGRGSGVVSFSRNEEGWGWSVRGDPYCRMHETGRGGRRVELARTGLGSYPGPAGLVPRHGNGR